MNIAFLGASHAARHLSAAAAAKGFTLTNSDTAQLIFVSEDTPTDEDGRRNMWPIMALVARAKRQAKDGVPIILTSQCEPGFSRRCGIERLYHQAETLRIKDAEARALQPEMLIVGCADPAAALPAAYQQYLDAFGCPILQMTYEEAEFSKMAINITLSSQVDNTNRLAAAAEKVAARWPVIAEVLRHDSRIGPHAYLEPGRWQDSRHLLRDSVSLGSL